MSVFYLTIDDAPTGFSRQKLEFLNSREIKAVWFCRGDGITKYPGFLLDCIRTGHIIGNHSYSHPHFSTIDFDAARDEIVKTDRLIDELYQKSAVPRPAKLFRFPYGDQADCDNAGVPSTSDECLVKKRAVRDFLLSEGFQSGPFANTQYLRDYITNQAGDPYWGWTYDIEEYRHNLSIEQINGNLDKYLSEYDRSKDQIVLIHDHERTSEHFPALIHRILDKGVNFSLPVIG